ncbi:T9SS type A sorting domain-containing protein [Bernardetia sp. ABR2-2B]|uniref:T9SS type A sorting domain-containing protein n=1 Tax=Bernardetia sp. ABR2-2B TaxID=3127472 RepID=UPI0030CA6F6B
MKKITLLLLSFLFFVSFSSFGEGTAQLMPTGDIAPRITLQIWDNNAADRNSFTYGAPANKRLYVHAEAGEIVYYGFGAQLDGNNLHYRIRHFDTLNSIVVTTVANTAVPTAGAGFITNYNRAVAGPRTLVGNPTGYNDLSFVAPRSADYWIEFNIGADPNVIARNKRRIDFFDITVFSSTATNRDPVTGIVLGRLFSQSWDINCNSGDNPFLGTMFPYTPDRITLGIDFNGIRPFGFTINMNQFGTRNTGNTATDRLSRGGNESLPQYPIFLNNPDSIVYPTGRIPDLTISEVEARDCGEYFVRIEINAAGFVESLLDFHPVGAPDGLYTPGTEDVLLNGGFVPDPVAPAVTSIVYIPWDGNDGLGNPIPQGTIVDFIAYVQSGLTHLPLFDVENHTGGFRVSLERPTYDIGGNIVADPALFWDDQTILGDTRNLNGATSPAHTWSGENNDTRNTWFYIRRVEQASQFTMDRLDFELVDNGSSGVCTTGQNNEFNNITFDVTINPTKYEAWQLNYATVINNSGYTLNLVSVDSSAAPYNTGPPENLPRRDIFVTYEVVPDPETTELDFNFIVTGNVPNCPGAVTSSTNVFCDDILLPITLLDFNARHYSDNSVLIDWQTTSEKDNQGFYVQRSTNGQDFKDITFIEGKGTTNNQSSYEFIDEEYWTGTAYYRLAQLDNNGEINLTKAVSVERNFSNNPFTLYPNPNRAGGELNLRGITDKSSIQSLQVVSITGQQVLVNPNLKITFDGVAIDLPQKMAKGVYIVQFVTEFGMQNYKFVIE